jgi:hypothetical protein
MTPDMYQFMRMLGLAIDAALNATNYADSNGVVFNGDTITTAVEHILKDMPPPQHIQAKPDRSGQSTSSSSTAMPSTKRARTDMNDSLAFANASKVPF